MKRVLIAMSDTGGGHRSVSQAIQGAISRSYGDAIEAEVVDVFALDRPTAFDTSTRLYTPMLRHAPWLYGWIYHLSDHPQVYEAIATSAQSPIVPKVRRLLEQRRPDAIISVHPLANHVLLRAREQIGLKIPIIAQVTELVSVHASWVDHRLDAYITATPETTISILKRGVDRSRVHLVGLPVDGRFGALQVPPAELRRVAGLSPNAFTALLIGGGEGAGGLNRIIRAIDRNGFDGQMIVVCGRNRRLRERLESRRFGCTVQVLGFIGNMPELMHMADVVITKGGPTSIMEALVSGRPVILTEVTPGQEEGNDRFIDQHGVGFAPRSTRELTKILRRLSEDPSLCAQLTDNADRALNGRRNAADEVAHITAQLLGERV